MALSPDLISRLVFGLAMFFIGIVGIWIVKWSTDRVTQATRREGGCLKIFLRSLSSTPD